MKTYRLTPADAALAGKLLREGELVVFPTETVYGLGANALDADAVRRIYVAKGRPSDNPLIAHVASLDGLSSLWRSIPDTAWKLAEAFWPGPMTMVLPRTDLVPDAVTAGLDTVAVRFPSHPVAQAVIREAGVPIAAPSANLSGKPSPTEAAHVLADLDGRVAAVLDGGPCAVGLESTVIAVQEGHVTLYRPGGVSVEMLEALLGKGNVEVDPGVRQPVEKPKSPGMKYRHYAPSAPLTLFVGQPDRTAAAIREALAKDGTDKAAVLCFDEYDGTFPCRTLTFGGREDYEAQAHRVFDALRQLDTMGMERLYGQCPPEDGVGLAVSNRLTRAAGFHVVRVD